MVQLFYRQCSYTYFLLALAFGPQFASGFSGNLASLRSRDGGLASFLTVKHASNLPNTEKTHTHDLLNVIISQVGYYNNTYNVCWCRRKVVKSLTKMLNYNTMLSCLSSIHSLCYEDKQNAGWIVMYDLNSIGSQYHYGVHLTA